MVLSLQARPLRQAARPTYVTVEVRIETRSSIPGTGDRPAHTRTNMNAYRCTSTTQVSTTKRGVLGLLHYRRKSLLPYTPPLTPAPPIGPLGGGEDETAAHYKIMTSIIETVWVFPGAATRQDYSGCSPTTCTPRRPNTPPRSLGQDHHTNHQQRLPGLDLRCYTRGAFPNTPNVSTIPPPLLISLFLTLNTALAYCSRQTFHNITL